MKQSGTGRWFYTSDRAGGGADPLYRLGAAVVGQAIDDVCRGVSLRTSSPWQRAHGFPEWRDAVSAARFLLVDVWNERCTWHFVVRESLTRRRVAELLSAYAGHAAFSRVVRALALPPLERRKLLTFAREAS